MPNSQIFRLTFIILIFSIFSSFSTQNNSLFSPFNKYDLSTATLLSLRESLDNSTLQWFSYLKAPSRESYPYQFFTRQQMLGVGMEALMGIEQYQSSNRFGAISGGAAYRSPYLDAFISADVYSTERRIIWEAQDIQFERFIKEDFNQPIEGMFDFRVNLPEAYLETKLKFLTLAVGKQKLRWGPGYKGTLGLSGTAYSPFYYYNLNLDFGKLFHMGAFLSGYDDESFYSPEINYVDTVRIKNNGKSLSTNFPRYGAGQRLDIRIGKHLQLGFYELVDFFGSNELTRFANPLQIYYLANESSGTNNANLLGGMDINVIVNRFRVYGEFLNDDITVFEDAGNPNKYAWQLGTVYYGEGKLVQTGLEYTHVSRYVYSHSRVLSRHSVWGESMGWPWGNDQDLFCAHAVFVFPHNINGKVELNYWLKGKGQIEDDWYADGRPDLDHAPYLPQGAEKESIGNDWWGVQTP